MLRVSVVESLKQGNAEYNCFYLAKEQKYLNRERRSPELLFCLSNLFVRVFTVVFLLFFSLPPFILDK